MIRGRSLQLMLVLVLVACAQDAPSLRWLSPTAEGTLSGKVRLSVEPSGSVTPPNVVFSLDDQEIAKAYLTDGVYETIFDTAKLEPGVYTLRATPYGAQSVALPVTVARNVPGTTDTVIGTPNTPADTPADTDLGDDPLNLGGLLDLLGPVAGGAAGEALQNVPGEFPWDSLWRSSAVRAQARRLVSQQTEVTELPRGDYTYNEELEMWEGLRADAGSLVVSFSYPDPEDAHVHDILIIVDWSHGGPTEVVASQLGDVEVPTATRVSVTDNGETILDLDLGASWRTPEGCREPILEPEELSLVGYTSHARPEGDGDETSEQDDPEAPARPEIDASDVSLLLTLGVDPATGDDTLELALDLLTTAGSAQADLNLEVAASGEITREDCFASGGLVSSVSLATEVGIGLEGGPRRGSRFSVLADEPQYNQDGFPTSVELEGEVATFDEETAEEEVTSYRGTLDETNGDGLPGENVSVLLPDGDDTTLDVYIEAIYAYYRAMIDEKISGLEPSP